MKQIFLLFPLLFLILSCKKYYDFKISEFNGILTDKLSGKGIEGLEVTIEGDNLKGGSWEKAGTAVTGKDGYYSVKIQDKDYIGRYILRFNTGASTHFTGQTEFFIKPEYKASESPVTINTALAPTTNLKIYLRNDTPGDSTVFKDLTISFPGIISFTDENYGFCKAEDMIEDYGSVKVRKGDRIYTWTGCDVNSVLTVQAPVMEKFYIRRKILTTDNSIAITDTVICKPAILNQHNITY
jgi:5-hydroxyisourate hydrolase-like protein (transthyretin family)